MLREGPSVEPLSYKTPKTRTKITEHDFQLGFAFEVRFSCLCRRRIAWFGNLLNEASVSQWLEKYLKAQHDFQKGTDSKAGIYLVGRLASHLFAHLAEQVIRDYMFGAQLAGSLVAADLL